MVTGVEWVERSGGGLRLGKGVWREQEERWEGREQAAAARVA